MRGPSDLTRRYPAVAGRFYPAEPSQCRALAQSYLKANPSPAPKRWIGALVPHAGWICSGAVAGQAIATLAGEEMVDVVVVFGAIHTPIQLQQAALSSHRHWAVPGGETEVSWPLQQRLKKQDDLFAIDDRVHEREHAIEVNVPLIQLAFPGATVLPIEIPPIASAELMGRRTARAIADAGLRAVYLASSDLTHYGPNYRFTPAGVGPAAMEWSKENDRRLLRLVTDLAGDKIIPEVQQRYSACGAGAIAALLGACREAGATSGQVLWHTNSYETLATVAPQPPTHAVGYAAVVMG